MLILKTIADEKIWGGNSLTQYSDTNSQSIGHLYSLISNGDYESKIINGKYNGKLFKDYFQENKKRFGLDKYSKFPFVIALVDAKDNLSLQVHPNDIIAQKLENNEHGKNESWYFIEIPKGYKLYNGCKIHNLNDIKYQIMNNNYNEIVDSIDVEKGDYVYVEAGTLHAISAGALVYEIEENCDVTYRFYDFDRVNSCGQKRKLHTEKALQALDISKKSKVQKYNDEIKERFYSTQLLKNTVSYTNNSDTIECLTIINGNSVLSEQKIQRGTTIVLEPREVIELNVSDIIVSRPSI